MTDQQQSAIDTVCREAAKLVAIQGQGTGFVLMSAASLAKFGCEQFIRGMDEAHKVALSVTDDATAERARAAGL